jgi:D-3-phosphoglycerate dehydrogenase
LKHSIAILESAGYPAKARAILDQLGEVVTLDAPENLDQILQSAEVLVIRLKYLVDASMLRKCPRLNVISTATTGLDHIDLATTADRGISVLSLRGETEFLKTVTATAEHTWGLLLALIRHIPGARESVLKGAWDRTPFFGRELQGRTLGVIGLGRIGQMVARYGLAFRMRVIAFDPIQTEWVEGVSRVATLAELLRKTDFLTVHVPLSEATRHLLGPAEFARLRRDCVLINTSRGAVLDESALIDALEANRLAAAALDVIHGEYEPASHLRDRLLRFARTSDRLLITPHLGGATHDSLEKVEIFMARKLERYLRST